MKRDRLIKTTKPRSDSVGSGFYPILIKYPDSSDNTQIMLCFSYFKIITPDIFFNTDLKNCSVSPILEVYPTNKRNVSLPFGVSNTCWPVCPLFS